MLTRRSRGGIDVPLGLALAALLFFIPANLAPLLSVTERGAQRQNWLSTGVAVLWNSGFEVLAVLVATFTIIIPFVHLTLLVVVLGSIRLGNPPQLGRVFRWTENLRPWMMVEVYLVGSCVAYSRLQKIAFVNIGLGGWCLMASGFALLLFAAKLDARRVWDALAPRRASRPGARRSVASPATCRSPQRTPAIVARDARRCCTFASRMRSIARGRSWSQASSCWFRPT